MSIRLKPFPSEFIINKEDAGADKYFSKDFKYRDLLLAYDQYIKDYTDLTQVAKNFYSAYSTTLSDNLNPFYEQIVGSGGVKDVDENFVRWRIYSKPDRRAISMGNPNIVADCYGASGYSFKIRLDVDWFGPNDLLAPVRNKRCIVKIENEPHNVGGAYEYEVTMLTNPDNAEVFPVEYFKENDYWIKMGSIGSDRGSNTWGSLQFGFDFAYIEFEVPMTTMQWKFSVEEDAHRKWGNIEMARAETGDDGMRPIPGTGKFTNFLELEGMKQIQWEKELFLTYGEMTNYLTDRTNGTRITTGPGFFQYMEEGNELQYSPTANGIDQIIAEIEAIWFDRIPIGQRKLLLYTGQGGLKLFHQWVEQKFHDTAVVIPHDFILGSADATGDRKGLAGGTPYQFTKYLIPVFGEITVAHWSILDNTRVNGVNYPGTHYPVSSFEFIAMDIGFGEPNIQLLTRKSKELTTYIPGRWSPFGYTGQDNPVFKSAEDSTFWGYHWIHRQSFGLVVMDPSRTMRFRPNVAG